MVPRWFQRTVGFWTANDTDGSPSPLHLAMSEPFLFGWFVIVLIRIDLPVGLLGDIHADPVASQALCEGGLNVRPMLGEKLQNCVGSGHEDDLKFASFASNLNGTTVQLRRRKLNVNCFAGSQSRQRCQYAIEDLG